MSLAGFDAKPASIHRVILDTPRSVAPGTSFGTSGLPLNRLVPACGAPSRNFCPRRPVPPRETDQLACGGSRSGMDTRRSQTDVC
jgi:hypothetical protein